MRVDALLGGVGLLCLSAACEQERPPAADDRWSEADAGADAIQPAEDAGLVDVDPCTVEPGLVEATGVCGNLVYEMEQQGISLYFLVDRSGSMNEPLTGSTSKYDAAIGAIDSLLELVGHRASYGAAVFPGLDPNETCDPGGEIFAVRRGDRLGCPPRCRPSPRTSRAWRATCT